MRTQEYQPGVELIPNFELCIVEGEEAYVDSLEFKQFYEFYLCFDLGYKDKYGHADLVIIKISKEQWDQSFEGIKYEIEQLPNNVEAVSVHNVLSLPESQLIMNDAIYELVDQYESQGFDN